MAKTPRVLGERLCLPELIPDCRPKAEREVLGIEYKRICKQIDFQEELDLQPLLPQSSAPVVKHHPLTYELDAVLVHEGPSYYYGRYVAYIRDLDGQWYDHGRILLNLLIVAQAQTRWLAEKSGEF